MPWKFTSIIFFFFIFGVFANTSYNNAKNKETQGFAPWYTGPIVAGSANCLMPGIWNIQPYIYFQDTYGTYDQHWGFHSQNKTFSVINTCSFQRGLTNWMDITFGMGTTYNKKEKYDDFGLIDMHITLAFQALRDKKNSFQPSIRFGLIEVFPSGKYENLSPEKMGADAMGGGSYVSSLFLHLSKIQYWWIKHPLSWRINLIYNFFSDVDVHGFNSYGGGFGTDGTVKLENMFTGVFAFEFSLTQRWVLALDTVYIDAGKTKFKGNPGIYADGSEASNTLGHKYQLSFAPAIEYNISENGGFIGGVWLTAMGENSSAFISGILSFTYTF